MAPSGVSTDGVSTAASSLPAAAEARVGVLAFPAAGVSGNASDSVAAAAVLGVSPGTGVLAVPLANFAARRRALFFLLRSRGESSSPVWQTKKRTRAAGAGIRMSPSSVRRACLADSSCFAT